METYFNIRYEFDKSQVLTQINARLKRPGSDYICVADGNITANVHNDLEYRNIVNDGMFSICDGSWNTIFLRLIYGIHRKSYPGSDIFIDLVRKKKYSMAFLGGSKSALAGLEEYLIDTLNYSSDDLLFLELPFCKVDDFNYSDIAQKLNNEYDIIWVGLGAPKQEIFMNHLRKHLNHGIMIGVGAVFNFYGNTDVKRAPKWMRNLHLEFLHRIFAQPKRQIPKLKNYLRTIPKVVIDELKHK